MRVHDVLLRVRWSGCKPSLEEICSHVGIDRDALNPEFGVLDQGQGMYVVHLAGEAEVESSKAEVFSNPAIGLQGPPAANQ